jgi:hypothetical protein
MTRNFNSNLKTKVMKNGHHIALTDAIENRMKVSNHKDTVPNSKLSSGSIAEKHPVILDDGRTVIYIADKSREREIRLRYALRHG